jgi:hypothetical protein
VMSGSRPMSRVSTRRQPLWTAAHFAILAANF